MKKNLTNENIIELLNMAKTEEDQIRNALRTTMNVYITLLTSILAGVLTICSLTIDFKPILVICCAIGGLIEMFMSFIAFKHYQSDYKRQAEIIVSQAKLENLLELDSPKYALKNYWQGETLIPQTFVESRKSFKSSKEFIEWFSKNNDIKIAKKLYLGFFILGLILVTFAIVLLFI